MALVCVYVRKANYFQQGKTNWPLQGIKIAIQLTALACSQSQLALGWQPRVEINLELLIYYPAREPKNGLKFVFYDVT